MKTTRKKRNGKRERRSNLRTDSMNPLSLDEQEEWDEDDFEDEEWGDEETEDKSFSLFSVNF